MVVFFCHLWGVAGEESAAAGAGVQEAVRQPHAFPVADACDGRRGAGAVKITHQTSVKRLYLCELILEESQLV